MRLNVGVVFGGKSVEHEVSIISALQMIENMNKLKYNPITIYLTKDNDFYYHEDMTDIKMFKNIDDLKKRAKKVIFHKQGNKLLLYSIKKRKIKKLYEIDVIFLVTHGTNCEDGTLSAFFELLNVPYVGSNILSSALNQNKWKAKALFKNNNIPVIPYYGFYDEEYYCHEEKIINKCEALGYPLIVKPATLGSSVGIKKCHNREDLKNAIIEAIQYDTEILVEKALIEPIELNCSVLGNYIKYETSLIERVFQEDEILSYDDKYLRGKSSKGMVNTSREIPANISEELKKEIEELSCKAAKVIGASGVIRIDYLYDQKNKQVYLNEINTIPGSLSFYLWKDKGKEYYQLIDDLIDIAIRIYRIKNNKIYSYDSNLLALTPQLNKGKLF
ncbi:MAG TPA: D-alanine--D-alanine ligase family protein [Haloplasmataceae bacterium]